MKICKKKLGVEPLPNEVEKRRWLALLIYIVRIQGASTIRIAESAKETAVAGAIARSSKTSGNLSRN